MGQSFSVQHSLDPTATPTKSIMLLVYANQQLTPLSILDFVRQPASFSSNPILIVEPFAGETPIMTAPIKEKLSYADTYRAIHTIYKLTPYQFKSYRLWLLTSNTISQSLQLETLNFCRKYEFLNFSTTMAIDAPDIFYDLKSFSSFSSAIRPPSAGLRCSSPVLPPTQNHLNLNPIRRSHASPLMTTFLSTPQNSEEFKQESRYPVNANDIDFVETGLYIGNEFAAQNRELLSKYNISHIVNLNGNTSFQTFPGSFEYFHVKLNDSAFDILNDSFWDAIHFIKMAIKKGGNVLVHCCRGISRSAALCVAYLMETKKMQYEEAFLALKKQRPVVNINQTYVDQIKARANLAKTAPKKQLTLLTLQLARK